MGAFFQIGETKIRPGSYIRYENRGGSPEAAIQRGIGAAVFKADWGPLGVVMDIQTGEAEKAYGTALTTHVIDDLFAGGISRCKAVRLGTGGTQGSLVLKDSAAANVVTITAKYAGTKPLTITIRDSLTDIAKRECIVYDGTAEKQRFTFTKGGAGEVDALVAEVAKGSDWITASKTSTGSGLLASITQQPLAGGANPVITNTDYSNAFSLLESQYWNGLVVDTNDVTVHALLQGYIDRILNDGKLTLSFVGEPTSVTFADRKTHAAAFNDFCLHYVLNGFQDAAGNKYEGYRAAARVAGMVLYSAANESMTHAVIKGATALVETLTNPQIEQALQSGAIVLTTNSDGQVQIEYAINTLVSLSSTQDAGWKKIRRVKTRFELMERITAAWDKLVGKVDNDKNGRATLLGAAQGIINKMFSEGKLLEGGTIIEDADNPAQGDSAWFAMAVDDMDSAEKLYLACGFEYAPQTTA
jgi:hypothetical protein